jgi:imidazole glycerol-phosphate synthase subunit HisF
MFRQRVIPVLLLKGDGLVKTRQFSKSVYIGDPINAVRIFNDSEADEVVFLDIAATVEKRTVNVEIIRKIAEESYMPFSVGGGITSVDEIGVLLKMGAEKVCLNSILFSNPKVLNDAREQFGRQSIIAAIDVKTNMFGKKYIYSHSGTIKQTISIKGHIEDVVKRGAGELMINMIEKDGMMTGYDNIFINEISKMVDIPLIICGGAGNYSHLTDAFNAGASACGAGSIFVFHGKKKAVLINYPSIDQRKQLVIGYNNDK